MKRIILIFITIIFLSCQKKNDPTPTTQTTTNPTPGGGGTNPVVSNPNVVVTKNSSQPFVFESNSDIATVYISNIDLDSITKVDLLNTDGSIARTLTGQSGVFKLVNDLPIGTYIFTVRVTILGGSQITSPTPIDFVVTNPTMLDPFLDKKLVRSSGTSTVNWIMFGKDGNVYLASADPTLMGDNSYRSADGLAGTWSISGYNLSIRSTSGGLSSYIIATTTLSVQLSTSVWTGSVPHYSTTTPSFYQKI